MVAKLARISAPELEERIDALRAEANMAYLTYQSALARLIEAEDALYKLQMKAKRVRPNKA